MDFSNEYNAEQEGIRQRSSRLAGEECPEKPDQTAEHF